MGTCITRHKRWLDNDKHLQKDTERREKKEALKKQKEEAAALAKIKKMSVVEDLNGKPKEFSQKNPLVATKK